MLHEAPHADAMVRHQARVLLKDLEPKLEPRVGRAWFPVVSSVSAEGPGGLVRVDVFDEGQVPRGAEAPALVYQAALQAGAALAGNANRALVAVLWPREAQPDGRSHELAVMLAAWSRVTGLVLPERLAASGWVDAAQVVAPDLLVHKRAVVDAAWGTEGRLISGPTGTPGVDHRADPYAIIGDYLGLGGHRPTTERLAEAAREAFRTRDWHRTVQTASAALAQAGDRLPADEAFGLAAWQAHALARLGRHAEAETTLSGALARWGDDAPIHQRTWAIAVLGVVLVDGLQLTAAVELLTQGLQQAADHTDAAARYGRAQLHGTLARALSAQGAHVEALEHGRRALNLTRPYERARNLGDLAHWHLRAGMAVEAEPLLIEAETALPSYLDRDRESAETTGRFLVLFRARLHLALGDTAAALKGASTLLDARDPALQLGAAELMARLGRPAEATLARIDAGLSPDDPPSLLSRLRARAELAGPHPHLDRVARWVGEPVGDPAALAARLAIELPY